MVLDCRCKGISDTHIAAALAQAAASGAPLHTREQLYAKALEVKLADPDAFITGMEGRNGKRDNCGSCRPTFEAAVHAQILPPAIPRVIPIASAAQRIGSCGKDCNTCAPAHI